jgi:PAS domain S-box-containing protein
MMRILIVDDHELVRKGIRSVLAEEPTLTICGEASNGHDAVEQARALCPDIIVMDISMPVMNGLEATRKIKRLVPKAAIVIVSQHQDSEMFRQALDAGAKAYVVKSSISNDLLEAIAKVSRDGNDIKHIEPSDSNHTLDTQEVLQRNEFLEKTIRENEERFREMLDALPVAIYTTDAKGRLTYFNPAAIKFSGREPELGSDQWCVTWKLFYSDGKPMRHEDCPMALAIKEGRIVNDVEAMAERPDGTRVWFTPYPSLLHDDSGAIVGGINMLLDITERKRSEQAKGLLASIVDFSDDAIISKNLDGIITSWNSSAEKMFGYTAQEAIGRHITLIIPADRQDEEKMILERIKRGEQVDHFETVRMRKDSTEFDISVTISPVKDAGGQIVGASKVARDISERKQTERALRESEERFRAIVETTPECVKVVTNEGTLLHMNASGLVMVGADSAEMVVGKSVYDLIAAHDRERFRAFNERICLGERGSLQFDIVGLNGVSHHMETYAAPLRLADSRVVQLAVTRDITRQKQNEEELRSSEERLRVLACQLENQVLIRTQELERRNTEVFQQAEQLRELSNRLMQSQDDERRRIARNLHDSAGQVITALGMSLSTLLEYTGRDPKVSSVIEDSQDMLHELTTEIRTLSYLLHPPLLEENGLVGAIHWYIKGINERSGLNIRLDISNDFDRIASEMELTIFRIVQECLTNIHRHSGSKTASIRLLRKPDAVLLQITDEGKGIPSDKLDWIQTQRSGVGITGMRERIRHLRGVFDIQSSGKGTIVSVTLPCPRAATLERETVLQATNTMAST